MPLYPGSTPRVYVRTREPVAGATRLDVLVRRPDGEVVVWEMQPAPARGPDWLEYQCTPQDLPLAGNYLVQPDLVLPAWQGLGRMARFEVRPPWT